MNYNPMPARDPNKQPHGGKRDGAGRPGVNIDEKRLVTLRNQGFSYNDIAGRFDVPAYVLRDRAKKIKRANTPRPD